jgi:hypothetical protein
MNREEWDKLSEENKWLHYKINLNGNNYLHHILQKESKKDTREDNSDKCWFNGEYWYYINPFNPKQRMYVNEDGLNVSSINLNYATNRYFEVKSVWQKVESIKELKVGDFISVFNHYEYEFKGIISKIDYFITIHYFDEWGVGYRLIKFKDYKSIEKAVLVEE